MYPAYYSKLMLKNATWLHANSEWNFWNIITYCTFYYTSETYWILFFPTQVQEYYH